MGSTRLPSAKSAFCLIRDLIHGVIQVVFETGSLVFILLFQAVLDADYTWLYRAVHCTLHFQSHLEF